MLLRASCEARGFLRYRAFPPDALPKNSFSSIIETAKCTTIPKPNIKIIVSDEALYPNPCFESA